MKTNKTIVCGFLAVLLTLAFTACPDDSNNNNNNGGEEVDMPWTAVSDNTFGSSNIYAIAYGKDKFVTGGYDGYKMAYSTNGITWTWIGSLGSQVNAIVYGNGRFVAVGEDGKMAYANW